MSEIFLEERIKNFLERFFNPETKPVQSLLFYGEEAVGKKTIALAFAKALLCEAGQKTWNGCGHCQNCLRFDKDLHPDFLLLEPVDNDIPIETVRKAIEFLHYEPQFSFLRILIINEADRLKEDAQNTLLKTLEEPPQNTLIIFLTAYPQKLLATVLSRLLPIRFPRSSAEQITNFLIKKQSLNKNQAQEIAQMSEGKIGLALKMLDKEYLKEIEDAQKKLTQILKSDFLGRLKYLQALTDDKERLLEVLKLWLEMLNRDLQTSSSPSRIKLTKELLKAFHLISNYNINNSLLLENIFLNHGN